MTDAEALAAYKANVDALAGWADNSVLIHLLSKPVVLWWIAAVVACIVLSNVVEFIFDCIPPRRKKP
jgi:Na+/H+ antiporter NhaB